jgi:hypothetical protein
MAVNATLLNSWQKAGTHVTAPLTSLGTLLLVQSLPCALARLPPAKNKNRIARRKLLRKKKR